MISNNEIKMTVSVDRLFLATDNPRHEEVDDEMEAIDRLCQSEDVEALARDIARYGTSPAERLIVYPVDASIEFDDINKKTTFVVAEGNRRMCALKLLHDPDKAPARIRASIEKSSQSWEHVDEMDVVVILDQERRRHWMRRIHDGVQGGVGRKPWNAEQKTRFSGSKRNIVAQLLFDYAVKQGMMTADDRRGSFSHMARLVGNELVADALGLDTSQVPEELMRNRSKHEFDILLGAVLDEAFNKNLGSQARKAKIDNFARELHQLPGVTPARNEPELLEEPEPETSQEGGSNGGGDDQTNDQGNGRNPPKPPQRPAYVRQEEDIYNALSETDSEKLKSLYFSICKISAKHHTPLIAVGIWSFLECLTASIGRADKMPFKDFLTKRWMTAEGLGQGRELNALIDAIARVASFGNVTKHHHVAANFDFAQLVNDMKTLSPVILACVNKLKDEN